MKRLTLTNLLLLTSATLFTACSTKDVKPKKNRTTLFQVHNEPVAQLPTTRTYPRVTRRQRNHSTYDEIPLARTYPIERVARRQTNYNTFDEVPMARTYPIKRVARIQQSNYNTLDKVPMARTYPIERVARIQQSNYNTFDEVPMTRTYHPIKEVARIQQSHYNTLNEVPMARTYPIKRVARIQQSNYNAFDEVPMARTYPIERVARIQQRNYNPYDEVPLARTYPIERVAQRQISNQNSYETPKRNQYFQPQARIQPRVYRNYRDNSSNLIEQIERDSKTLLGKKYIWGATGPYCYDCSGFTQKIYRDAGINIPRISREQARVGKYVNYEDLKKGDMVFFDTKKKRSGKVTHVGIYLGNGNFIHASSAAKKVVIFNFNKKEYYKKRFLWGRRLVQDNSHMASL